jgi:hypothetical protein
MRGAPARQRAVAIALSFRAASTIWAQLPAFRRPMQLFAHKGITPGIRRAFVVYLASHNHPLYEVLLPALRDISQDYERTFKGETADPVALPELLATREQLIRQLHEGLDKNERKFLLSLAQDTPDWDLLGFAHFKELPGLRSKLRKLSQLAKANSRKFTQQARALADLLG